MIKYKNVIKHDIYIYGVYMCIYIRIYVPLSKLIDLLDIAI